MQILKFASFLFQKNEQKILMIHSRVRGT